MIIVNFKGGERNGEKRKIFAIPISNSKIPSN